MILMYISDSCSSCRKSKKKLDEMGVVYEEKNISKIPITKQDVMNILTRSAGFDEILSKRSDDYQKLTWDKILDMTTQQLINYIIEHPRILRRPVIIDFSRDRIQFGYSKDELKQFASTRKKDLI